MDEKRLKRKARLMYVSLEKMRVRHEVSQRKFNQNWANTIASNFNLEDFGNPTVNKTGEWFWILDGQHRVAAIKQWLGDWKGQKVECWVYYKLSDKEEANLFDRLNSVKAVGAFDKFQVRLTAEREDETNISAIVGLKHLKICRKKGGEGEMSCVGTLGRVYRLGADCLSRDLEITYESFGDSGLEADILGGIGLLVSRYDGRLDDKRAIAAFSSMKRGVNALRTRAGKIREQVGGQRPQCIAAAAVEAYNRSKGGKKLPNWWKSQATT